MQPRLEKIAQGPFVMQIYHKHNCSNEAIKFFLCFLVFLMVDMHSFSLDEKRSVCNAKCTINAIIVIKSLCFSYVFLVFVMLEMHSFSLDEKTYHLSVSCSAWYVSQTRKNQKPLD